MFLAQSSALRVAGHSEWSTCVPSPRRCCNLIQRSGLVLKARLVLVIKPLPASSPQLASPSAALPPSRSPTSHLHASSRRADSPAFCAFALMPVIAHKQRQPNGQRHARENQRRARSIVQARGIVGAVDLVVHVVAVVVRPSLGYRLDDGCDVEEGAALCVSVESNKEGGDG